MFYRDTRAAFVAVIAVSLSIGDLYARQQPAPPGAGQPAAPAPQGAGTPPLPGARTGGPGRGGPRGAAPLDPADHTGFQQIFDGVSMKGWDGDPAYWRAENGSLVGQTTEANPLKENTFVIWSGGEPADFELKLEYRMSATNSGIQFRSTHVPQGTSTGPNGTQTVAGKWVLKGYQADIDFANQFTGMIYEERGRGIVMMRGQAVYIGADAKPRMIGDLERTADELKGLIKPGEWNTIHLIARGNTLVNIVNGHVTAILVDDDVKGRASKGLLGFQIHVGPPMKVEFRNVYLKTL
jgi:3-keto-disaccharide hydrolase